MSGEIVREWVRKAEADWMALSRLQVGSIADVCDVITFHAQQCAEKYLKALIQQRGNDPPRVHHLPTLLDLLVADDPDLEDLRRPCENLTPFAIFYRYPGESATEQDAAEAIREIEQVRAAIRERLNL